MKRNCKKIFMPFVAFIFLSLQSLAQGIVITKTDNTKIYHKATNVESFGVYDNEEESEEGIVVNKTDGTKVYYKAAEVESVGVYGYGEEPEEPNNPEGGIYTVNGVSFKMVSVSGGTFKMGSTDSDADSDEAPVHNVTLSDYQIGETEVTQALWVAVMGSNPSSWVGDNLPVENVSWNDCQTFITKLNAATGKTFRLPTEAEWEFAARGGTKSQGYKYSGSNTIGDVAWYTENSGSKTHEVGTKQANELGLYDMSGNVYEWCQDWMGYYDSSAQSNPTGPTTGSYRVHRCGSWNGTARSCRVSYRGYSTPTVTSNRLGLRLAL